MVPADAHGCPACPHPAVGPAIQGSPNVLTNGLPSVRVGDAGIHAACCGPNKWNAKTGSRSVLINGRPAHRLGDLVRHCGGIGHSIAGSHSVLVGDSGSRLPINKLIWLAEKYDHGFLLVHEDTGLPAIGVKYAITLQDGREIRGITDFTGKTMRVETVDSALALVEVIYE